MTMGSDWDVFNQNGDKIAEIDGSKFNLGGKWKIKFDENFKIHPVVDEVLVLFCAFVKFEKEVRERIEKNVKNYEKDNEYQVVVSHEEAYLYNNPRRLK